MPSYAPLMKCCLPDPCKITQTLLGAEVAHGSVILLVPGVWNKPLKESSVRSSANQIICLLTGTAIRCKRQFVWRKEIKEQGSSNSFSYFTWYIPGRRGCLPTNTHPSAVAQVCLAPSLFAARLCSSAPEQPCYQLFRGHWEGLLQGPSVTGSWFYFSLWKSCVFPCFGINTGHWSWVGEFRQ